MITMLDIATVTARKQHICTWCREEIEPGDKYERSAWADSGTAWTQKAHPACADLIGRYAEFYGLDSDDPVEWSDVIEWQRGDER